MIGPHRYYIEKSKQGTDKAFPWQVFLYWGADWDTKTGFTLLGAGATEADANAIKDFFITRLEIK